MTAMPIEAAVFCAAAILATLVLLAGAVISIWMDR